MSYLILKKKNINKIYKIVLNNKCIIVCFCVNWCETCKNYKNNFLDLSKKKKNINFIWIDIDKYNLNFIYNLKINNFPIILIEYKKNTIFFNTLNNKKIEILLNFFLNKKKELKNYKNNFLNFKYTLKKIFKKYILIK